MANVPIMLAGGGSADLDQITATASDILAPKKSVNGDGDVITGTIPSLGTTTWTPGTSAQTLQSGQYLSGTQTISAISQTNLSAENIKKGTTITIKGGNNTIYSVTGTWEGYVTDSATFYDRGTKGTSTFSIWNGDGTLGTSAIINPDVWSGSSSSGYIYNFSIVAGPKSAINYTKLIIEGTNFKVNSSTPGSSHPTNIKYATSAASAPNGTDMSATNTGTSTKITIPLTSAAINAGNVYWFIQPHYMNSDSTITKIYFQ